MDPIHQRNFLIIGSLTLSVGVEIFLTESMIRASKFKFQANLKINTICRLNFHEAECARNPSN